MPTVAARVQDAHREEPFLGGAVPGYLRKPFGPGWTHIGDAGYNKDPITAQGITDAFHDAERGAMQGDQDAMDGFVSVVSGALSPQESFSPHNASRILDHERRGLPQPV